LKRASYTPIEILMSNRGQKRPPDFPDLDLPSCFCFDAHVGFVSFVAVGFGKRISWALGFTSNLNVLHLHAISSPTSGCANAGAREGWLRYIPFVPDQCNYCEGSFVGAHGGF